MTNRVLVTGGAGFLGRHVAAALAAEGAQVAVLDNLSAPSSTFQCPELKHDNIECIEGSVLDAPLITRMARAADIIVHFASVVGVEYTMAHPIPTMKNLAGTINLVESLGPHQTLLFGSSADVYGVHSHIYQRPMREDDWVVYEPAEVQRWVYARVKALEESLTAVSAARSVNIRFFNAYGPGMDFPAAKRVIPQFVEDLLEGRPLKVSGDGRQYRSFCYYKDTVEGVLLALRHATSKSAPYTSTFNIGHTETFSILEVANLTIEAALELGIIARSPGIELGAELYSCRFDDTWNRSPSIERAQRTLGFSPRVSLREGLRRTLEYYCQLRSGRASI